MEGQKSKDDAFATTLKDCRLKAGLTQKEVAERADLSTSYIALLEAGKRSSPRRDIVKRLAYACDINEAFFVRTANICQEVHNPHSHEWITYSIDRCDLETTNDTLMNALVKITEDNAPELNYAQILQKLGGLSLWWKFFIVCLYENSKGVTIIAPHEKLHIQERIEELEKLGTWGSCEERIVDFEKNHVINIEQSQFDEIRRRRDENELLKNKT